MVNCNNNFCCNYSFYNFYLIFFYEDSKLDNNVYDNQNNLIYDNETDTQISQNSNQNILNNETR